jgi:hypothetical protein
MTYDDAVAQVIQERLAVSKTIDNSAELSFLESANFRLELFDIVTRFEDGAMLPPEALAALRELHQRVTAVIAASAKDKTPRHP